MPRHRRSGSSGVGNAANNGANSDLGKNTQASAKNDQSHSSSTSSTSAELITKTKRKKHATFEETTTEPNVVNWKTVIGFACLGIATYFGYVGYLETRVNTPFDNTRMVQRSGLDDPERYWGSYRPLNYFGMKTRDPHSPVVGLMWYMPTRLAQGGQGLRHWCDMGDHLGKYTWTHHDGRSFGVQEIIDNPFELRTSFIKTNSHRKYGGDWTARVSVKNISRTAERTISLIWYVALDERTSGHIKYVSDENSPTPGVYGETTGLGEFQIRFHPIKGRILHKSYLSAAAPSLTKLKDTVFSHFRVFSDSDGKRFIGLPGHMIHQSSDVPVTTNFIAIQVTVEADFAMDVTYQSTSGYEIGETIPKPPISLEYTAALKEKIKEFDRRFEDTFNLKAKGFSEDKISYAKHALSNMIGGIGYFYGASRVQSVHTKSAVPYWKAPLYTAVPSRSFFPRGFLWDEGFHGLLISSWDLDIELDIICHWFDLLNVEGWIPREQILGAEALDRVPEEFVIQRNTNANPPSFLLTIRKILNQHKLDLSVKGRFATLERLYPRLQAWFNWFNTTQRGELAGTYYWRGRDAKTERELNPKTLSSGLDDYPRASHPTSNERHLDLRCWIAFAADVMSELSDLLGKDSRKYYETAKYLMNNDILNLLHLSTETETYADWGLHTDKLELKRPLINKQSRESPHFAHQQKQVAEMVRVTHEVPTYRFADSTFGYVNLFPFLMGVLEHDSIYLKKTLDSIYDPEVLWTNYGLRSLSKKSPLYMKRNTEHDPPYWRGRMLLQDGRLIYTVADRFLFKLPGWGTISEAFHISPGTIQSCVNILKEGNLLAISPGGVYEAQFGDHYYELLWRNRVGFAKVALEAKVPIIPCFTQNLREGFRQIGIFRTFFLKLYNKVRIPVYPLYGGFPVKFRTFLGKPIKYDENLTPQQLQAKVAKELEELINSHQRIPGSILHALFERLPRRR